MRQAPDPIVTGHRGLFRRSRIEPRPKSRQGGHHSVCKGSPATPEKRLPLANTCLPTTAAHAVRVISFGKSTLPSDDGLVIFVKLMLHPHLSVPAHRGRVSSTASSSSTTGVMVRSMC